MKWPDVAALVRKKISDGTLKPGDPAPSGAALARETGICAPTCGRALRALLAEGTLAQGVTPEARLRVAWPGGSSQFIADRLRTVLSASLSARRLAAGMTQPDLAEKTGVSVTTVGHAETGRVWQSREFWQIAGRVLGDDSLLVLYDCCQAAGHPGAPEADGRSVPVLPASVTITRAGVLVTWPDGTQTLAAPPGGLAPDFGTGPPFPVPSRSMKAPARRIWSVLGRAGSPGRRRQPSGAYNSRPAQGGRSSPP